MYLLFQKNLMKILTSTIDYHSYACCQIEFNMHALEKERFMNNLSFQKKFHYISTLICGNYQPTHQKLFWLQFSFQLTLPNAATLNLLDLMSFQVASFNTNEANKWQVMERYSQQIDLGFTIQVTQVVIHPTRPILNETYINITSL